MTVQFSALVNRKKRLQHSSQALTASRIPHSGRNSFLTCPGLLSAVGSRMYSSRWLLGGNAHVIHPACEVAILLVKTVMTPHHPFTLELWQNEFQWCRFEAWLQLSFPFEANSTWTIDQQLGMSIPSESISSRQLCAFEFGFTDFLVHWERVQELNLFDLGKSHLLWVQQCSCQLVDEFVMWVSSDACKSCPVIPGTRCFKPFSTAVTKPVPFSQVPNFHQHVTDRFFALILITEHVFNQEVVTILHLTFVNLTTRSQTFFVVSCVTNSHLSYCLIVPRNPFIAVACSRHSQSCVKIKHNQDATTQRDAWLVNGLLQNTSDSIATIRCTACFDSYSNFALWCIHDDVLDQLFLHRDFSLVQFFPSGHPSPSCTILTRLTWISWLVCRFPRHLVVVSRQQSSIAKLCFQRLVPPTPSLSMTAPAVPVHQLLHLVVTHRRVQVSLPFVVPLLHVVAASEVHGIPPTGFHFQWCLGTHPHIHMCIRTFEFCCSSDVESSWNGYCFSLFENSWRQRCRWNHGFCRCVTRNPTLARLVQRWDPKELQQLISQAPDDGMGWLLTFWCSLLWTHHLSFDQQGVASRHQSMEDSTGTPIFVLTSLSPWCHLHVRDCFAKLWQVSSIWFFPTQFVRRLVLCGRSVGLRKLR